MNILEEIRAFKVNEVKERKSLYPVKLLEKSIYFQPEAVSLKTYLQRPDLPGVIAEFKRKSPSKGVINGYADPKTICLGYMQAGASALSVLTDSEYFGGSAEDLKTARKFNYCPILRKDFIVDEYQIIEARSFGADVVLLIAEILDEGQVKALSQQAKGLGLEVLLEVHSEAEIAKWNDNIDLIGINNRNLKTFEVHIDKSVELLEKLPQGVMKIAESGIRDEKTVVQLKNAGFDGFLIGELFMSQPDPAAFCSKFIQNIQTQLA